MDWRLSQPGFGPSYRNLVCLATLMSSDRTKQICLWMTIYIFNIYMIYKYILLITFLNEPDLIFCTIKWFQVLLSNTNNSIYYLWFVCTQLIGIRYFYVTVTFAYTYLSRYTWHEKYSFVGYLISKCVRTNLFTQ